MKDTWHIDTLAVQAGHNPSAGEASVAPMVQSTTYRYDTADQLADLFDLKAPGHMYSRISNPTVDVFEQRMAALDGGVGALGMSSGQAAMTTALLNIASSGDHIISSSQLYGGTVNLLGVTFKRFGVDVTFVAPEASAEEIASHIKENTRFIYGETLANPALTILDIEKFAKVAHEHNMPLIVDNTFPTPYLLRPKDFGADIITYSSSKYLDGHARALGGVIVDCGTFDWTRGNYPELTEPDPSYHGLVYTEAFGNMAFILKARVQLLRDLGTTMSPMNAWITTMGMETLHLRMERHSSNAQKVAEFLESHSAISWVNYPGLKSSKEHDRMKKYLPKGAAGVLTFGVKGGLEAAKKLSEKFELARLVVHVSDARTGLLHPASTTHRQLPEDEMKASGVTPDLIRFSVGIEHPDDIIADLDKALKSI